MAGGLINAPEAWDKTQPNKSSLYVTLANDLGSPIPVFFSEGEPVLAFNESLSVAIGATVDLVSYTVPASKVFSLSYVEGSGSNVSEYSVFSDATLIGKRRTSHGAYDFISPFGGAEYAAGTIVKVSVENVSGNITDYSAKILGNLKDA